MLVAGGFHPEVDGLRQGGEPGIHGGGRVGTRRHAGLAEDGRHEFVLGHIDTNINSQKAGRYS